MEWLLLIVGLLGTLFWLLFCARKASLLMHFCSVAVLKMTATICPVERQLICGFTKATHSRLCTIVVSVKRQPKIPVSSLFAGNVRSISITLFLNLHFVRLEKRRKKGSRAWIFLHFWHEEWKKSESRHYIVAHMVWKSPKLSHMNFSFLAN